MKQLLNDVYHNVARNVQKEVEVNLTYDFETTDANGATAEASESESITHHH